MTSIPFSSEEAEQFCNSLLKHDLSSFISKVFHTVNPGTPYLHNWHIDYIASVLEAATRGDIHRLIINMPPRSLKSVCVSVAWPAWILGNNPAARIMAASYSQQLSLKHSLDTRLVMNCPWYKQLFPNVTLANDQNEKTKFATTQRGYRFATSVGGTATGEGGNYLIIDDPHNPLQAASPLMRRAALEWFDHTFSSRLDDKKNGVIVLVMQRLHEEDLSGHLLHKAGNLWHHLSLPAIAPERTIFYIGKKRKIRKAGDILHSGREGRKQLEQARLEMGEHAFAAQYQQCPIPSEGTLLKAEWFHYYQGEPWKQQDNTRIIQSWDTAIKASSQHDYSICLTWIATTSGYFLADVLRRKMEYPELKRTVLMLAEKWHPHVLLIEDKASGQSLLQDIKRETSLPAIAVKPSQDKVTRFAACSTLFEAGKIFLPQSASFLATYEAELLAFPNGSHDDMVDATSQFLNYMRERKKTGIQIRTI